MNGELDTRLLKLLVFLCKRAPDSQPIQNGTYFSWMTGGTFNDVSAAMNACSLEMDQERVAWITRNLWQKIGGFPDE